MKLKVCGMKYQDNILEAGQLLPDYLGFIFYDKSSRYFEGNMPKLNPEIKKVGVFVNASIDFIMSTIEAYQLDVIQLHGQESAEYCSHFFRQKIEVIKAFSVDEQFDFSELKSYERVCNYFLFDTKGKLPGGNGYAFNWEILSDYPSKKPFFLSGGIGFNSIEDLKKFRTSLASQSCHAIDVNSKFEIKPGLKNISELEKFKHEL